jgi:hypothetical protein
LAQSSWFFSQYRLFDCVDRGRSQNKSLIKSI